MMICMNNDTIGIFKFFFIYLFFENAKWMEIDEWWNSM